MNKYSKYIYVLLLGFLGFALPSCVDDSIAPEPPEEEIDDNLPEELKEGLSIKFNIELGSIGEMTGQSDLLSRASVVNTTNAYLREIENYIDLETLRILFFVCVPLDGDIDDPKVDKTLFKKKRTKDYFLFESKSRFVTPLTNGESTSARWQVIAPVFTYGNNDEYDWEAIRYALTHYNFKIALLVNRPNNVDFHNFDSKFGEDVKFDTDRGPTWGVNETWIDPVFRNTEKYQKYYADNGITDPETYWKYRPTINDLHHCQWDAVYSSKNNYTHVYDFIMGNPWGTDVKTSKDKVNENDKYDDLDWPKTDPKYDNRNLMGALSYWTESYPPNEKENYYVLPSPSKGIPMYGVQKFICLGDQWVEGTPFNVSNHENYNGDNVHLLRSLAKLELKIPREMELPGGKIAHIEVDNVILRYSNVMARCEPLDVETPTDVLWSSDVSSCEWYDIFKYGPIVNNDDGYFNGVEWDSATEKIREGIDKDNPYFYQEWVAWFYGSWRHWWHFNSYNSEVDYNPEELSKYVYKDPDGTYSSVYGLRDLSIFDEHNYHNLDYPRIFNPVIQRNNIARLLPEQCQIADAQYHHYVVYTGERNINDPSDLRKFSPNTAEAAFFQFNVTINELNIKNKTYCIALADYNENPDLREHFLGAQDELRKYTRKMVIDTRIDDLRSNHEGENEKKETWNWPLLRNHLYSFTVTKFGSAQDNGGIDVQVINSENRYAPPYVYY